jgi:hypothetical protein
MDKLDRGRSADGKRGNVWQLARGVRANWFRGGSDPVLHIADEDNMLARAGPHCLCIRRSRFTEEFCGYQAEGILDPMVKYTHSVSVKRKHPGQAPSK